MSLFIDLASAGRQINPPRSDRLSTDGNNRYRALHSHCSKLFPYTHTYIYISFINFDSNTSIYIEPNFLTIFLHHPLRFRMKRNEREKEYNCSSIVFFSKKIPSKKTSSLSREGVDTIRLITASSWIIRITSWTTLGQALDKRGSIHPSLLYPANFQHLHADTRIGSGFSFATAIQSCKSGVGVALLVAAIELLLDRIGGRKGEREREEEEERPTNPGFT